MEVEAGKEGPESVQRPIYYYYIALLEQSWSSTHSLVQNYTEVTIHFLSRMECYMWKLIAAPYKAFGQLPVYA
jgi:hypothetical protein